MSGPARTYCPAFPEDFLREAGRVSQCKTALHQLVQRAQMVLLLHRCPHLDDEEAGRCVGLSGRQVRRWRTRWAAGTFGLGDMAGRGRKAWFSPLGPRVGESRGL